MSSQLEQTEECVSYQLDESTSEKLDDRPFPHMFYVIICLIILEFASFSEVSNLLAHMKGSDIQP